MSSASTYYYDQLNKEQKKAYYAMKEGLEAIAPSFPVPRLSGREIADIYFLIRMDHPELFYSVKFNYRYYPDSDFVEFIPEYLFPKAKIKEHQQAMTSRIRKLVLKAQEKKTDLEKEQFIHDFLCENVQYDKLKKPYSHEIIGSLGNGVAVCEGIAKAVKVLCDALGIWCIIALCGNNPEKGIKYRHTWNVIRMNGKYYHLDVTFDHSLCRSGVLRYDYMNICDKQIYRDHEPSLYRLPECPDADAAWYREKKLSFTKMEDVRKRTAQAVRKKKPLVFHWRGGYLTRKVLIEMLTIFREEAAKKDQQALVSVNWAQAVILIKFEPKPTDISDEAVPKNESALSDSERSAPDSESAVPEHKAAEPETESTEPKIESAAPDNSEETDETPSPIDGISLENANEGEED